MKDPQRILILALAGAGDALMSTPLIRELRMAYPNAAIDVLVMQGEPARGVFDRNPAVQRVILFNFMKEGWRKSLRFCLSLRGRYDLSISTFPQNRLPYNAVSFLIGAPHRIGFDYTLKCGAMERWLQTRLIPEDPAAHVVKHNLRILSEAMGRPLSMSEHRLELYLDQSHVAAAANFIERHGLIGRRLFGIHPGSGTTKNLALRRWPPEQWSELARLLAEDPPAVVLMFGSQDEKPIRDEIRRSSGLSPNQLMDAETPSIHEAAALMGYLKVFVCCDTLLTHLAAARGIPTVVIMGPTPHTSVYPYGVPHVIARAGLPCSPCYHYSKHGIVCTNAQPMECLKLVTPRQVLEAVNRLVNHANS